MNKKILGIDIGVASVGWGIIDQDNNVVATGVRLFQEADNSSNEERRNFRGNRRLKSRRKIRIKDMRDLLVEYNIIGKDEDVSSINPYEARYKGLTQKLTNKELASALLHIAKRRGSSLEVAEEESTNKDVSPKKILADNKLELMDKYVVEVQLERLEKGKIRNQKNIFKTEDYVKEVKQIFKNQNLSEPFKEEAIAIIERRRHFSEGPGSEKSPTPYGRWRVIEEDLKNKIVKNFSKEEKNNFGAKKFVTNYDDVSYVVLKNKTIINKKPLNLIDLMRGKCSVYSDELRAPKNSYSALIYNLLDEINNMTIVSRENGKFTKEEKEKAIQVIKENGRFKPNNIDGFLKLFDLTIEDIVGYRINANEKPIITEFKTFKELLDIFKDEGVELTEQKADSIADILTKTQVVEERKDEVVKIVNNENLALKIANLKGYNGYHAFSFKALKLLKEELLNTNLNQQQILSAQSLREEKPITKLILDETLILSAVARRAHREALKVINELIGEFGNFDRIVIETTREKNSKEATARHTKNQKRFIEQKTEAIELLKEAGFSDNDYSNQTALKVRLYNEQNGKCAYSGMPLELVKVVTDPKAYEIDHIIPRSISQDNSLNNKVLVLHEVNQAKGNRTPFQYFSSGLAKKSYPINNYNAFKEYVNGNVNYQKNAFKRRNLLNEEDITKYDVLREFSNRNLIDTSYAARSLMTTIKNYFKANNIETTVLTIRGKQTDMFRGIARGLWNQEHRHISPEFNPFNKDRNYYNHHALDALIIAGLSNQKTLKYLFDLETTKKETYVTKKDTGEVFDLDPAEDSSLLKFLKNVGNLDDKDIRFSWKVDKKINRSFSNQTIYSTRKYDNDEYLIQTHKNIYEMKQEDLSKIFEDEKESEKLLIYQHDRGTFDLIKKAYLQYKHEKFPLKAYMEQHGKIKKNGVGPYVTNLKYRKEKLGNHIDITKSTTKNKKEVLLQIRPYRTDIYKDSNDNYKFVTIRYADFSSDAKGYYIDKNLYAEKLQQKGISENFKFTNSFHTNEIIAFKRKDEEFGYYRFVGTNNDVRNQIEIKSINKKDNKQNMPAIGKKIEKIYKYAVSPAGRIKRVENERLTLVR